jgi:hypothetical protein
MSTATIDTTSHSAATTAHPVRRAALVSGAVGAAATTAFAAAADAAGVPFAIDGETIPLLGFAQMVALGVVIGGVLAAILRRRQFVALAVVLTALSCIPSVTMPPDTATRLALVATHVLAAAIIVPALARQIRR